MRKSPVVKLNFVFLSAACVFTIAMELYAAQPWGDNYAYSKLEDYLTLLGMMLWSISIYIALFIALLIFASKVILIKTYTIGMMIIVLLSSFILFDTNFIHINAQGGLVFLFLPIYQWLAFFLLLFICDVVFKFRKIKAT